MGASKVNGHYQINLPLRNEELNMPSNRKNVELGV